MLSKNKIIIMLIAQMLLGSMASAEESILWNYAGRATPDHWSKLDKKFQNCNEGEATVPFALNKSHLSNKISPITFKYEALNDVDSVFQSKHIRINDITYKLVEFHIHLPSEHSIEGNISKAAIHFVHQDTNNNIAVVAVMVKEGRSNQVIKNLIASVNKTDEERYAVEDGDISSLIPKDRSYYLYKGPLSTPPCTENVNWYILQQPIEVSIEEMKMLNKTIPIK